MADVSDDSGHQDLFAAVEFSHRQSDWSTNRQLTPIYDVPADWS